MREGNIYSPCLVSLFIYDLSPLLHLFFSRMLAVVASLAHNQEVIGSNPIPAPIAYR